MVSLPLSTFGEKLHYATRLFEAPDYYKLDDLLSAEHKLVRDAPANG